MDSYTLVRTEHLNHHGKLFGGQLLKWVDEYAWMAASRDFCGSILVTRAMENLEFRNAVPNGSIMHFSVNLARRGTTSATYSVDVYADMPGQAEERLIFTNSVTFVAVDMAGNKIPLSPTEECPYSAGNAPKEG